MSAALGLFGIATFSGSFSLASAEPVGTVIDYEQTANAILPPASSFAGTAGGDGWALVFDDTNVYNVFHHTDMKMACHSKSTAASCSGNGYTAGVKTIKDGTVGFYTAMNPSMAIDPASGHMLVWGLKPNSPATAYGTLGVVEVDLDSTSANPFVAFHPLSRANEASCYNNQCATQHNAIHSNAARVGSKWYVYNYVSGVASPALPDSRNKLLCFDIATMDACAGQPYDVQTSGAVQARKWEVPNIGASGNRVFIDIPDNLTTGSTAITEIACVDVSSTPTNCPGWPIEPPAKVGGIGVSATPFPMLNSSGTPIGVCFPGSPNACTDFDGVVQTINSDLETAGSVGNVPYASARSEALVYGTRVYIPRVANVAATANEVWCYDFATNAHCSGFPAPKSFVAGELGGLYSIQQDPAYPTCLWVNANDGTKQIQNFDYETGGACGAGGSLLPISDFLESQAMCEVREWKKFTLVSPGAGEWTSGTVEFDDASGNAISGVATQNIGADGTIDLTSLNLQSHSDFAKLRVKLTGATVPTIDVKMKWSAEWHPECVARGQTALTTTTTVAGSTTSIDGGSTTTVDGQATTTDTDSTGSGSAAETPSTGDDARTWLRLGLMLLALGAFAVAAGIEQRAPQRI